MRIEQSDVARLSDVQLKHLAIEWHKLASMGASSIETLALGFSRELVRLVRERHTTVLCHEQDLLNDDEPGALLGDERARRRGEVSE